MKTSSTNPKLTPEILANLERINAMSDDDIDFSDIPEITDFSNFRRGKFYRPVKQQVTLRLDADLVHWFKAKNGGARGYQTQINAVLRRFVEDEVKRAGALEAAE